MTPKLLFTTLFILLVFSCKKSKEEPVDFKYDYIPEKVGHYCIYNVTEIIHDDAVGMHDTTSYVLKEKIESMFTDDQGRPSMRIERFKQNASGGWDIKDVWYGTRTTTRFEKIEEDERYIRMAFPVKTDQSWNGNAYNTLGEQSYKIKDVDVSRSFNSLNFTNTAFVSQMDEFNFVQRQLAYEVYAKNVGLVSKYYKNISITGFDTTTALTGSELHMTIISYGVE